MSNFEFKLSEATQHFDTFHISSKRIGKARRKRFSGYLTVNKFIDKDTAQYVLHAPSFDVSGYGENEEKAFSMLKDSLDDLFLFLSKLSLDDFRKELNALGWKKDRLRNKDFSNVHVDEKGELQNLNAVDNKVERLALVA